MMNEDFVKNITNLITNNPGFVNYCVEINTNPQFVEDYNYVMDYLRFIDKNFLWGKYSQDEGHFFENNIKEKMLNLFETKNIENSRTKEIIEDPNKIKNYNERLAYLTLEKAAAYNELAKANFRKIDVSGSNITKSLLHRYYETDKDICCCLIDVLLVKFASQDISLEEIEKQVAGISIIPKEIAQERILEVVKNKNILDKLPKVKDDIMSWVLVDEGNYNDKFLDNVKTLIEQSETIDLKQFHNLFKRSTINELPRFFAVNFSNDVKSLSERLWREMEKENKVNSTLAFYRNKMYKDKLAEAQNNPEFVKHCQDVLKNRCPNIDEAISILSKISKIDINNEIKSFIGQDIPKRMNNTKQSLIADAENFFEWCDLVNKDNSNGFDFVKNYKQNQDKIVLEENGARSHYNTGNQMIYVGCHQSIKDNCFLIHECTHSFSNANYSDKNKQDFSLLESSTMLTDAMCLPFFDKIYPDMRPALNFARQDNVISLVANSKNLLMEAIVCKLTTEPEKTDELLDKYSNYINENRDAYKKCFQKIDSRQYDMMKEYAYTIPTVLAENIFETEQNNPQEMVNKLAIMIQNLDKTDVNGLLEKLQLGKLEDLTDDYVKNYHKRFEAIPQNKNTKLDKSMEEFIQEKQKKTEQEEESEFCL